MRNRCTNFAAMLPVIAAVSVGGVLFARSLEVRNRADEASRAPSADAPQRLREGSALTDVLGYFELTADGATFRSLDGKARLVGLQNLNLQRIAEAVREHPDRLEWVVSGTVTEYRGANFLLIKRALLKTRSTSAVSSDSRRDSQPSKPELPNGATLDVAPGVRF